MHDGLGKAGYPDARAILQGSAITGKSFKTASPFNAGRISDFDIAVSSQSMLQAAKDAGIGLRSGGTRTGPLSERDVRKLGLFDLANQATNQVGRPVNFMIYNAAERAIERAPSIFFPK